MRLFENGAGSGPVAGFDTVVVVGVGLVGGSFASALARLTPSPHVIGVDTDADAIAYALEKGIIAEGHVVGGFEVGGWGEPFAADLVVLATPVEFTVGWIEALGAKGFSGVATDVGSTKLPVVEAAREHLAHPELFVPGHPMAGRETSGVTSSRADLFDGAYWLLTPSTETDAHVFRRLHTLLTAIGARVISVDPSEHDSAVAIVSHVPHVAASSLVALAARHAGDNGELLRLAAGGFKDTTRVASGSPELWTGICLDNADAIARGLREFRDVIGRFEKLIDAHDADGLHALLKEAADVRDSLPAKWVPDASRLTILRVPMGDRPGVIAEITGIAGRTGCDIQAIDIDHQTESSAILQLILTDQGDHDAFRAMLVESGFHPRFRPLDAGGTDR